MVEQRQRHERCLSVVVPCFNEADTISEILRRVLASPYVGEVIVVDDASTDGTLDLARRVVDERLRVVAVGENRGKGAALREGFKHAALDFVIVQDADLEYNPEEYGRILRPLLAGDADVVYGSRFKGSNEQRVLYFWHSLGNRLLTLASNIATNLNLTDMETCYKAFRREVIQAIVIEEDRFGFEPEVTAKLAARRARIFEVGISYHGRTYEEGKKVGWRDGIRAGYCILAYSRLGGALRVRRLHRVLEMLTGA